MPAAPLARLRLLLARRLGLFRWRFAARHNQWLVFEDVLTGERRVEKDVLWIGGSSAAPWAGPGPEPKRTPPPGRVPAVKRPGAL